jgi:hypothetical protein
VDPRERNDGLRSSLVQTSSSVRCSRRTWSAESSAWVNEIDQAILLPQHTVIVEFAHRVRDREVEPAGLDLAGRVITRSPGRSPRPSSTSTSGGQHPECRPHGVTDRDLGADLEITCFCENVPWAVSSPEMYSLLNSTGLRSGGVRLATIDSTQFCTLNGSSLSGAVPRPP